MAKAKILIVEDQVIISTNVRLLLKFNDYDVTGIASTADEAFKLIEEKPPDLILMDISLPGKLDGIEATIIINEKWNIPVIYLTAHTDEISIQRAKETAPYGYITKDIELKSQLPILIDFALFRHKMESVHARALTELRDSEEKFRSIASSARDAIIFIGNDKKISFWNDAATEIFGYTQVEAIGNELVNLVAPESFYKYYKTGFSDFVDNGTGDFIHKTIELQAKRKNGSVLPIEVSLSPVKLKGQWCACGIIRDVTARKNTEEEINKLIEELQLSRELIEKHAKNLSALNVKLAESEVNLKDLNASKDKFFTIIAHDLKGPFQGLLGYAEILSRDLNSLNQDEIRELANDMHSSAEHLFKLLENLLQWSRLQRGVIEYNPDNFQVSKLVQLILLLLQAVANQKKIKLINKIPEDLYLLADVNMVNTIFRNLISNAIKFTKIHGKITISSKKENDKFARLFVADDGIGIEPEDLKKLFRIDSNHSTAGTANEKGTGLGLILCKDLVEKNNGKIEVESKVNSGTTFSFTLPLGKEL
ncbi:MAG: ATP-binding protein [Bacteroidota bacterium]